MGRHGKQGTRGASARTVARWEAPRRAACRKPGEVLRALVVSAGQTVGDVGAGPGYFSLRFARAVQGGQGRVFAADVEPRTLAALQKRLRASGLRNLTPVL